MSGVRFISFFLWFVRSSLLASSIFVNVVFVVFFNVSLCFLCERKTQWNRKPAPNFCINFPTTAAKQRVSAVPIFLLFVFLSLLFGLLLPAQILKSYRFSIFSNKKPNARCVKWILFFSSSSSSSSQKCVTSLHGFFGFAIFVDVDFVAAAVAAVVVAKHKNPHWRGIELLVAFCFLLRIFPFFDSKQRLDSNSANNDNRRKIDTPLFFAQCIY